MIERMEFLNITGPKDDIDRIIETYISKYDFQLENALYELKNVNGIGDKTFENLKSDISVSGTTKIDTTKSKIKSKKDEIKEKVSKKSNELKIASILLKR